MEVELRVPNIGESVTEVTLSEWFKEDGDYVELDEAICEFESDKATLEFPSEAAGIIKRVANEGDDLPIGGLVAIIDSSGEAKPAKEKETVQVKTQAEEKNTDNKSDIQDKSENKISGEKKYPSPAAEKIMKEKGISLDEVKGSGKEGRVIKQDVLGVEPKKEEETKKVVEQKVPMEYKKPEGDFSREERKEKMSRLRRTVSKRLVEVKNETAMLTTFNEVDMSRILAIRKQYKEEFKEIHGIGLGFMSFFAKASAMALQNFDAINAYIEDDHIIYHDYVDISIAVSTPKGLVVPVIRNAESLSFAEIESEVKRLAIAGRDGNLKLEEMSGGTFTLSNGGVFGSLLSTPIINKPQSAILGMHKIQERPVAIDGKVEIRPMMYLALSYDHRIVDGKESVSCLVMIKDFLENPEKMLLGTDPVRGLLKI